MGNVRWPFIGTQALRVDMAYEDVKVAIEYDGEQHWSSNGASFGDATLNLATKTG